MLPAFESTQEPTLCLIKMTPALAHAPPTISAIAPCAAWLKPQGCLFPAPAGYRLQQGGRHESSG